MRTSTWELPWPVAAIPDDVDEAVLLKLARQGDEAAFAELYGRHQRPIYRYAARMCGRDAADDVVQDTFLAVLRQGGHFDAARGTFGGYLFGIARHLVLKHLGPRYQIPLDEGSDAPAPLQPADALNALTAQERVAAVRSAVESLPPAYRDVIALCDLEELDYQTAAQVLGCPIGTVRSRLHRARALLAGKLGAMRPTVRNP
jgi:RNA polymerase sigma-70 factor, ECF subfamily